MKKEFFEQEIILTNKRADEVYKIVFELLKKMIIKNDLVEAEKFYNMNIINYNLANNDNVPLYDELSKKERENIKIKIEKAFFERIEQTEILLDIIKRLKIEDIQKIPFCEISDEFFIITQTHPAFTNK